VVETANAADALRQTVRPTIKAWLSSATMTQLLCPVRHSRAATDWRQPHQRNNDVFRIVTTGNTLTSSSKPFEKVKEEVGRTR
jgi:hypothetical protein